MAFSGGSSAKTLMIIIVHVLCLTIGLANSREDHMTFSTMCNPQCTFGTTCIEQPSRCSFSNCPTYLSCIPPPGIRDGYWRYKTNSRLPQHLLRARLASESPVVPTQKPGCPNLGLRHGPCITQCQRDIDCGQGQICCPNSCGQLCKPDLRVVQVPRSGSCPRSVHVPNTSCESECDNDHDCPGMQKCCLSSCGAKSCTAPCFLQLTGSHWRQPRRCRRFSSNRPHRQNRRHRSRKFRSHRRRSNSIFT